MAATDDPRPPPLRLVYADELGQLKGEVWTMQMLDAALQPCRSCPAVAAARARRVPPPPPSALQSFSLQMARSQEPPRW